MILSSEEFDKLLSQAGNAGSCSPVPVQSATMVGAPEINNIQPAERSEAKPHEPVKAKEKEEKGAKDKRR